MQPVRLIDRQTDRQADSTQGWPVVDEIFSNVASVTTACDCQYQVQCSVQPRVHSGFYSRPVNTTTTTTTTSLTHYHQLNTFHPINIRCNKTFCCSCWRDALRKSLLSPSFQTGLGWNLAQFFFKLIHINWQRSRIFDLTSYLEDSGHIISHRKVLPAVE